MSSSLEKIGWRLKEAAAPMKGRASHGRQVPVPHVIPWFLWMSHCPQPIGLFNGIPQSSGFEHTSTGAYPAFLRFTGNVVPPFEGPRGSQLRLMRCYSHKPRPNLLIWAGLLTLETPAVMLLFSLFKKSNAKMSFLIINHLQ